jgi:hypothetical protein
MSQCLFAPEFLGLSRAPLSGHVVLVELADGRKGGGADFTTVIDPLSQRVRPALAPVPWQPQQCTDN